MMRRSSNTTFFRSGGHKSMLLGKSDRYVVSECAGWGTGGIDGCRGYSEVLKPLMLNHSHRDAHTEV